MADYGREALVRAGLRPPPRLVDQGLDDFRTDDGPSAYQGWRPPDRPSQDWDPPGEKIPITFEVRDIPLTVDQWLERDLPSPDRILGEWLTTTTRIIINAETGLGKTNFAMALAVHMAAGIDFLHWKAHRPARVLFIDGEMSRRLLKKRISECVQRLGHRPAGLFFLSKEDVAGFPPLNSPAGHALIKRFIASISGIDFVIFDNIMSLIIANHRETEGWQQAQPLVSHLTANNIGQGWIHHTGHDTTKGYGDKSREWTMDTVVHLTLLKRDDTDVSFTLKFTKARERTPETRRDFADVAIALLNDEWICDAAVAKPGHVAPMPRKFFDALNGALAGDAVVTFHGRRAVTHEAWKAECELLGLLTGATSEKSANSLFHNNRRRLIAANYIAGNEKLSWSLL
jgi:hypothetical protein